jgi:pyruvyltransferase
MKINLRHWSLGGPEQNFGDALSPYIVRRLLGKQHTLEVNGEGEVDLLAIGSWLHYAEDGTHIWGTGLRTDPPVEEDAVHDYKTLNVHAVRGPLTRDFLLRRGIWCPPVYGDPALLLPELFQPGRDVELVHKTGLVPHLGSIEKYQDANDFHVISPLTTDVEDTIRQIVSCGAVVSQSLHGLIVADAYHVPNVWLRDLPDEGDLKFLDYFASQGRPVSFLNSLDEFQPSRLWRGRGELDTVALFHSFPFY